MKKANPPMLKSKNAKKDPVPSVCNSCLYPCLINSFETSLMIIDESGEILKSSSASGAWLQQFKEGGNFFEICANVKSEFILSDLIVSRVKTLMEKGKGFNFDYYCQQGELVHWYHLIGFRVILDDFKCVVLNHLDITDRKTLEKKVLNEKQIALRELLELFRVEKFEFKSKLSSQINQNVLPYLSSLKKFGQKVRVLANIIEENMHEIFDGKKSEGDSHHHVLSKLSVRERKIYDLISQDMQTKEIASFLSVSPKTVNTHRNQIRKKLGLTGKKVNFQSYIKNLKYLNIESYLHIL